MVYPAAEPADEGKQDRPSTLEGTERTPMPMLATLTLATLLAIWVVESVVVVLSLRTVARTEGTPPVEPFS